MRMGVDMDKDEGHTMRMGVHKDQAGRRPPFTSLQGPGGEEASLHIVHKDQARRRPPFTSFK